MLSAAPTEKGSFPKEFMIVFKDTSIYSNLMQTNRKSPREHPEITENPVRGRRPGDRRSPINRGSLNSIYNRV